MRGEHATASHQLTTPPCTGDPLVFRLFVPHCTAVVCHRVLIKTYSMAGISGARFISQLNVMLVTCNQFSVEVCFYCFLVKS